MLSKIRGPPVCLWKLQLIYLSQTFFSANSTAGPRLGLRKNIEKHILVGGLNPSEKYWSIGMISNPKLWENKKMFQTTNQT